MPGESRQTSSTSEADQQSLPITYYFRRIPLELRRLIIETAALYDTVTAYRLTLTCSEFLKAAEPALYRNPLLSRQTYADTLLASLRARISRKGQTVTSQIKSLSFDGQIRTSTAFDIIQLCPKLEYLAFWLYYIRLADRQRYRLAFSLPLVSFSATIRIFSDDYLHPDFSILPLTLKFLDLRDDSKFWKIWTWQGLSSLTGLTHIALSASDDLDIASTLTRLMGEWRNAERGVCVLRYHMWTEEIEEMTERLAMFKRVVVMKYWDPTSQWDAHVRGRQDDWAIAFRKVEEMTGGTGGN